MGWFSNLTSSSMKPVSKVLGTVSSNVVVPAMQSINPAMSQLGQSLGLGLGNMNASADKQYWDNYLQQNQIDQLKNQMTAMKQAGLNPNLMYGNIGSSALNGASGGGSAGATGFFDALNMAAKMVANGSTAMYNAFVKSGAKQGMKNLLKKDKAITNLVQGQAKAQTIKNIKEVNKVVKVATGKGDNLLKGKKEKDKNEKSPFFFNLSRVTRGYVPVGFGRNKHGKWYFTFLGNRVDEDTMRKAKKMSYGSYGNYSVPRVYDNKSGKYIDYWGELHDKR